ncbi:MAG: glycosyltransferase involved in cell wall biosynthesis [Alteromonadaceae bacterium]|jgi:glycosyltransferase involved in cell wall biosynthesis
MKKLLFIVNVDWFFLSHRLPIAVEAIKQGFDVHLACSITEKKMELEAYGITIHPLMISRSGTSILNEIKSLKQVYTVVNSIKPDIIHTVTIKPVLYGNIVSRWLKVPTRISSISGLGYVFISTGLKSKAFKLIISLLYRIALHGANKVIFQNNADLNVIKNMGAITPQQVQIIRGSGVNLTQYSFVKEPTKDPVVMLVARLLIDKGVREFVAAAKLLKLNRPDIRMVLIGDIDLGNPNTITREELTDWCLDNTIEHWGYSKDIPATMAQANIIVLPSYREGLPKSLIEAAACGRAVITTDVPGCRDAIEPDKTGLLIPVKTYKPLAAAILTLVNNPSMRSQFSTRARELAEESFDIQDVVYKHLTIYKKI